MNIFLQQQHVRNKEHRRKLLRTWILRVQRISMVFLAWFAIVGVIYGVYFIIFEHNLFSLKEVKIEGMFEHTSVEDIQQALSLKIGTNLFSIQLKDVQKRVFANPWVKEVAVARKLPGTLWIYVSEHSPYAILSADKLYMVDDEGAVFKEVSPMDDKNFPVLTGISKEDYLGDIIGLLKEYSDSPLADYFLPAEVNVSKSTGYSIVLYGGGTVLRLGFDDLNSKLERFYSVLGAIANGGGKIRYVDLNIPGKVVVKYEES